MWNAADRPSSMREQLSKRSNLMDMFPSPMPRVLITDTLARLGL